MENILRKLYGKAVTEESLEKFKEELGKKFVPKSEFNQRGEELKMLREKLGELEGSQAGNMQFEQENKVLSDALVGLRKQYDQDMAAAKEREEKIHLHHAVDNALMKEKARNTVAVRALLNMEGISLEEGQLVGFDEQIGALKQECGYLFEAGEENLQFMRPTGTTTEMTQEDFQKLGYMEKLKLKKEQPELYQKFIKNTGGRNVWQRI